eukprot:907028-Pleurochrysis_carterae.AAC.1
MFAIPQSQPAAMQWRRAGRFGWVHLKNGAEATQRCLFASERARANICAPVCLTKGALRGWDLTNCADTRAVRLVQPKCWLWRVRAWLNYSHKQTDGTAVLEERAEWA